MREDKVSMAGRQLRMICLEAVESDAILALCGAASNYRSTIKETSSVAELLTDLPQAFGLGKVDNICQLHVS